MCDKLSSIQNATMLSFDYNIAKETFCASLIQKKCISGSTKYQIRIGQFANILLIMIIYCISHIDVFHDIKCHKNNSLQNCARKIQ